MSSIRCSREDEFEADADRRAAESGTSDKHSLFGMARKCAKSRVPSQRIYSTFVATGVDFAKNMLEAQKGEEGLFDNTGIRKSVLLFRFSELTMAWI